MVEGVGGGRGAQGVRAEAWHVNAGDGGILFDDAVVNAVGGGFFERAG